MVDHIVDASRPRGRVDIQVGAVRRRRWSDEVKGRIQGESYAPDTIASEMARCRDTSSASVRWRKAARAGMLTLPADPAPLFVPVVAEPVHDGAMAASGGERPGVITIGGVVVCAAPGMDPARLREVPRAVKATT
jgi:transposase